MQGLSYTNVPAATPRGTSWQGSLKVLTLLTAKLFWESKLFYLNDEMVAKKGYSVFWWLLEKRVSTVFWETVGKIWETVSGSQNTLKTRPPISQMLLCKWRDRFAPISAFLPPSKYYIMKYAKTIKSIAHRSLRAWSGIPLGYRQEPLEKFAPVSSSVIHK